MNKAVRHSLFLILLPAICHVPSYLQAATLDSNAAAAAKKRYEDAKKYELFTLSTWLFKVGFSASDVRARLILIQASAAHCKQPISHLSA